MNETTFSRAKGLYKAGDYRGALRKFTECLRDTENPLQTGESGQLYHEIGNCLMKMKNPAEAIRAYETANQDPDYSAGPSLDTNLGKAYSAIKDYDKATEHFQNAIGTEDYESRYKALMGLGNVQLKQGNSADAGRNFREAALDQSNPDPAKALLNLGVCFMSLGRPEDAIASYESARDFDTTKDTRERLLSSMGQAYAAANEPEKAVECFKEVLADGTYTLSDSASVDYTRCLSEVSRGVASNDGKHDLSGLDVSTTDETSDPYFYDEGTSQLEKVPGYVDAYEGNEEKFFTATDEEIKDIYKNAVKKERKRRGVGLKIFIGIMIVLLLAIAAAAGAYALGYGWPTQESVAQQVFANPSDTTTSYATTLSDTAKKQMSDILVKDDSIQVTGVERSMTTSKVYVTAKTEAGGDVNYCLNMARDMVGWKVTNIELYFASQNS